MVNHELLSDPDFMEIENIVLASNIFLLLIVIGMFLWWAGWQVLNDYEKQIKYKFNKVYKKHISIYQNQDDIV